MPAIHPSAAQGYSEKAETYDRGRPDYPAALDDWLHDALGVGPCAKVVDLGAGTGKFTRRLLATGANVIAVEPVPAMKEILERAAPHADAKLGTAQDIPLEEETVDAVVCAQSFHWFASDAALSEIRRVLKPGGILGLIWNVRDERTDWVSALTSIMAPFEGETPRYHHGTWRRLFPASGFGALQERHFPFGHIGSPEQVIIDRVLSVSFVAALAPAEQHRIEVQLKELIQATPSLSGHDEVTFPYETVACCCVKTG